LGGLPTCEDEALPKALTDEEWELMDKAERTEWKLQISKVHEDNAKMQSKRESLIRKLDMARSLRGETTY
jgi:DNA-directed RNA polymerase